MFLSNNSISRVLINLTCAHALRANIKSLKSQLLARCNLTSQLSKLPASQTLLYLFSWEHCLSVLPSVLNAVLSVPPIVRNCGILNLESAGRALFILCHYHVRTAPTCHGGHWQGQVFIHKPSRRSSLSPISRNNRGPSKNSFYWLFIW